MSFNSFNAVMKRLFKTDGTIVNPADGINADGSKNVRVTGRNLSQSFLISNGQQVSNNYVDLGGRVLVALSLPAGITQTSLTFQASDTPNGTYSDVYDANGTLVTVTIGAGRITSLTGTALQALASLQYIKIKTGTPVTADRTIITIAKG